CQERGYGRQGEGEKIARLDSQGDDVRRNTGGEDREDEVEGEGVRVGEVVVRLRAVTGKKREAEKDGPVQKKQGVSEATEGGTGAGGGGSMVLPKSSTKLVRAYRSNEEDLRWAR
ncbi:hypothetical protein A2U01_0063690, partial [Trifolium medium]|nr:hypothetical protein [Trifolium medium]